jgi:roadblock/LC7 domain-containing protein
MSGVSWQEDSNMVNLVNLMSLNGAVSAAECKPDGDHISYIIKRNHTQDLDGMTDRLCEINALMATIVESFNRMSDMNWTPLRGWAVSAGDYSVFVVSHIVVIVETDKADFNEIYKVLSEEARLTLKAA